MIATRVFTDVSNGKVFEAAPDLPRDTVHVQSGIVFGRLPNGTLGGKSTVAVFVPTPDGKTVIAEITMATFETIAAVMSGAEKRDQDIRDAGKN